MENQSNKDFISIKDIHETYIPNYQSHTSEWYEFDPFEKGRQIAKELLKTFSQSIKSINIVGNQQE